MSQETVVEHKPQKRIRLTCPNCGKNNWISVKFLEETEVLDIFCRYCDARISARDPSLDRVTPTSLRSYSRFVRQTKR